MTKTLETNITSEKGDEKSPNITNPITMSNAPYKKDKNSLYLLQYQKYFNKKLVIKYNILPNEYTLMNIDNFITAKYCHSLASFKEMLIFNYDEEFLKRFYPKKESLKKIPLFSEFYKSYLKFFCFPTLAELRLNDLIEDMVEKKAKAFYNENYKEDEKEKNQKKINVVIFTNKIRKDISRVNSLTNLSKTTIKNNSISLSNRSSKSLQTIEKLFNELNYEEKIRKNSLTSRSEDKINNYNDKTIKNISKNKVNKNANNINSIHSIHNVSLNMNSQNCALKNTVILNKMKNKSKTDDYYNLSNKINKYIESSSSGNRKKVKNKIKINLQNKLLESIPNTNTYSHTNANSILRESKNIANNKQKLKSIQKNIQTILKINSKVNQYKNILAQYASSSTNSYTNNNNKIISLDKRANSKSGLSQNNKFKEMKNKSIYNNYSNKNNNNNSAINKNNIIITNINNNNITNNNNIKINNNFLKINCNKHYYTNFKITNTISTTNNNSNRNIQKKAIKVVKKPSIRKIKKIKSRNYKSITSDTNTIFISNNDLSSKNNTKNNNSSNYYFTTNDKNMKTLSNKFQTSQNSRKKIKKYIRTKNNINFKNNNIPNSNTNNSSNGKVFNYINSKAKNPPYVIASIKKSNTSLSPSLKNLIIKTKGISNYKKNRVIESKNNTQFNNGSHNLSDSQRFVKNLKIVNSG
jgi:hypothetical protein